ncbi:hypothetical protein Lgra_0231 [Legionella gratiana]|uniref:Opacity protein and related surface antigens n=1 Tax=Legionella gratiana TaxID=45066 RepID=A0A378JJ21_9GAMM|nr:hypothetical protein [Legionella gratiana]KTD15565.1 hypothetical protein Lgra_0231 [Legionella gratiana]STX44680.1 Opacity protein and related surface antigens [Legionella gratiana]
MNQIKTKRNLFLSILITVNTIVSAKPPLSNNFKAFEGFYLGGNLGYGEGGSKKKFIQDNTEIAFNINDLGVRGVDGGVETGYIHRIGGWAFGLSLDKSWSNGTGFHQHLDGSEAIFAHLNNSFQVYARSGYVFFEKIMPSLGLGWDNSSWTLNSVHTNPFGVRNRDSIKQRQNAFLWKMGVDILISPSLAFGFEYIGTIASEKQFFYPNELFKDSWKPQYNKYAFTVKVIPFANENVETFVPPTLLKGEKIAFQGVYFGGNVGYGNDVGKKTKFLEMSISRQGTPNSRGIDGGVGLGYIHRIRSYAIGVAFDTNWSNAEANRINPIDNKSQTVKLKNSFQLYSRAGYVFYEKVMPFAGLGWDNSAWNLALKDAQHKEVQKRRHNALLWKIGTDFIVTKNTILGFEYMGTASQRKMHSYKTPFINQDTNSLTQITHEWNPQYNKIAITFKVIC